MSDLPKRVTIDEEGPREGFQSFTDGAAGNICTEDFAFLCEEMGVETGLDIDHLIEVAKLAEDVVGRPLPGHVMRGGTLTAAKQRASA